MEGWIKCKIIDSSSQQYEESMSAMIVLKM